MKFLIPLLMVGSLFGQKAVFTKFTPSVMQMTVGDFHCIFWLGAGVGIPAPYVFEVACYKNNGTPILEFGVGNEAVVESFVTCTSNDNPCTKQGSIIYSIKPDGAQLDYSIAGQGPDDITPPPENKGTV